MLADPRALSHQPAAIDRREVLTRLCTGGYEVQQLPARQRSGWFRDYLRTTIERDVVEVSGIRKIAEMRHLLRLFAARAGCELVMQNVIDDTPLTRQAVYDHRVWLQTIHLSTTVPAWSRNLTRRVKRRPNLFVTEPGLAAWLLGKSPDALAVPTGPATGQLIETFVHAELRQLTWADTDVNVFHWQDRAGAEVDLVLGTTDGRVLGVEIKAGQTAKPEWFRWLGQMRDTLGDRFIAGIALYTGNQTLPYGDRLHALPITALWAMCLQRLLRSSSGESGDGPKSRASGHCGQARTLPAHGHQGHCNRTPPGGPPAAADPALFDVALGTPREEAS